MSRLSHVDQEPVDKTEDVDEDILTYGIMSQVLDALCVTEDDRAVNLPIRTSKELLEAQQTDTYCQNMFRLVSTDTRLTVDENWMICRQATINGSMQVIISEVFPQAVLYSRHYPILAGHPGTCRMYDELRRQLYWAHMAANIYAYVAQN